MGEPVGPKFIRYFDPVLKALKQLGGSGRPAEVIEKVAEINKVSEAEQQETLKGGTLRFPNQVAFARQYLVWGGYLSSSEWGVWRLTEKGQATIEISYADALKLYKEQHKLHAKPKEEKDGEVPEEEESIDYQTRLLEILQSLPSAGFERLCQRLLRESSFEEVQVTGRSGDGGIDGIGIVKVNQFVTFKVVFQCKRYSGAVGAGQVRDFRGAMQGRADKAIILTTGTFSKDAQREAARDGAPPIELVDGQRLILLFEELSDSTPFGLNRRTTYDVDEDFFKPFTLEQ